jgi:hypothetical protein
MNFLMPFFHYDNKYYYHVKQATDDRIKHTQHNATCPILFCKALVERGNDKPGKTPFIRSFGHKSISTQYLVQSTQIGRTSTRFLRVNPVVKVRNLILISLLKLSVMHVL